MGQRAAMSSRRAVASMMALAGGVGLGLELTYSVRLITGNWEQLGFLVLGMAVLSAGLLVASVRYAVRPEPETWTWVVGLSMAAIGAPAAVALIAFAMS